MKEKASKYFQNEGKPAKIKRVPKEKGHSFFFTKIKKNIQEEKSYE